jgi:hypothetical protein
MVILMENAILELQRRLDEESSGRKRELETAKQLASLASNNEKPYLCRAWVVFMFAHCEQFLKQATFHYLSIIKERGIEYDLYPVWYILYGNQKIIDAKNKNFIPSDGVTRERIFQDILVKDSNLNLKEDAKLNNFSFDEKTIRFFFDWVLKTNLRHSDFKFFCKNLSKKRHAIAHGEESYVDALTDCEPWHEKTFEFMDVLKDALIEKMTNLCSP